MDDAHPTLGVRKTREEYSDQQRSPHRQQQTTDVGKRFEGFGAIGKHPAGEHEIHGNTEHQYDRASQQSGHDGEDGKLRQRFDVGQLALEELRADEAWQFQWLFYPRGTRLLRQDASISFGRQIKAGYGAG